MGLLYSPWWLHTRQKYKYSLDKFNKMLFLQWEYMSLKHNILRALGLYRMSTLKNFFKIVLGSHSAYGRTLRRDSKAEQLF